jgi:hypothetical protein
MLCLTAYKRKRCPIFKDKIIGEYDEIDIAVDEMYLIVMKDNKYGIVDLNNKVFLPLEYASIEKETDNIYVTEKDNKFGAIRFSNGFQLLSEPIHDDIDFIDGY